MAPTPLAAVAHLLHPDQAALRAAADGLRARLRAALPADTAVVLGGSLAAGTLLDGDSPDINIKILLPGAGSAARAAAASQAIAPLVPYEKDRPRDIIHNPAVSRFHCGPVPLGARRVTVKVQIRGADGYHGLGACLGGLPAALRAEYIRRKAALRADQEAYARFKEVFYRLVHDLVGAGLLSPEGCVENARFTAIVAGYRGTAALPAGPEPQAPDATARTAPAPGR